MPATDVSTGNIFTRRPPSHSPRRLAGGRRTPGGDLHSEVAGTGIDADPVRVCVIGSGTTFLSGISYYTHRLSCALAGTHPVSVILMRRLLPGRLYPGRDRIGADLTGIRYPPSVPVIDGVDWFWGRGIVRAVALLVRERPDMVLFQWWTGTVFHSYLVLALTARLLGARVVIEYHEVLDTGELRMRAARLYVRAIAPFLIRLGQGFVVHSAFDLAALTERYPLGNRPHAIVPHGPFDQYRGYPRQDGDRATPDGLSQPCNLLFFGVIRPFKGLEDLLNAFESIPPDEIGRYRLTVVGETWEGWTLPAELIARSRHRDRITFVNRYVTDEEASAFFQSADAVVLPYHRSSASGPLHVAMSHGLPVVVTGVGGLTEAVEGYEGAVVVPPHDPGAIRSALAVVAGWRRRRFADPHSWERTVSRLDGLFAVLGAGSRPAESRDKMGSEARSEAGATSGLPWMRPTMPESAGYGGAGRPSEID